MVSVGHFECPKITIIVSSFQINAHFFIFFVQNGHWQQFWKPKEITFVHACVTIVPFFVVMLEGHGMAGTYVVVSGYRYRMFGCLE